MIREDYIMRMIQQVGELVRRILNRSVSQIGSESDGERLKHFGNAVFFYKKCSGSVDSKLQIEIDKRLKELKTALGDTPEYSPSDGEEDELVPPPHSQPIKARSIEFPINPREGGVREAFI